MRPLGVPDERSDDRTGLGLRTPEQGAAPPTAPLLPGRTVYVVAHRVTGIICGAFTECDNANRYKQDQRYPEEYDVTPFPLDHVPAPTTGA